ncbi:MAG: hypothetical protein QY326_00325 [Bdellovibrionota bacterium]|nr:MAG: hypothetical protein QY326_00325 [Bdellovibrionota bacterium]
MQQTPGMRHLIDMTQAPSAPQSVGIFFHDREIAAVFGALLASRGLSTRVLSSRHDLAKYPAIVTEARYYQYLSPSQRPVSIVVGDSQSLKEIGGITLEQPLTEDKVEAALEQFISPQEH